MFNITANVRLGVNVNTMLWCNSESHHAAVLYTHTLIFGKGHKLKLKKVK